MLEEESQKWCLQSLKLNLAQKMQKCEAKTNVSLKGLRGGANVIPIGSLINRVLFKVNGSNGDSWGDGWSRIVTIKSQTLITAFKKNKRMVGRAGTYVAFRAKKNGASCSGVLTGLHCLD